MATLSSYRCNGYGYEMYADAKHCFGLKEFNGFYNNVCHGYMEYVSMKILYAMKHKFSNVPL